MTSFVCGQLCSGKTLYSKALAAMTGGDYIEVGDIVRKLKNTQSRRELQDSFSLAGQIVETLKASHQDGKDLVISGVRQVEILKAFPGATILWVDCPKQVRKDRYYDRRREGDEETFEHAECGDISLGIHDVKQYIFENR